MKLSVVLATYNEENNIKDCLESVRGWCDEIVVVDGGSNDQTVEIVKNYGAKVEVTNNPQIFHVNKQKAIDLATGDWILQLDADERVTKELRQEISSCLNKKSVNGYWLPRKNYFLGRWLTKGGQYPDYTLRLYRRGKGHLPQKDVHEQAEVTGKTAYLTHPLLHYSDITLHRYFLRQGRYTDLMARQLLKTARTVKLLDLISYNLFKPWYWFFSAYFRHKGFVDSWQGFLFAFLSALRFPLAYYKFLKLKHADRTG